MENLDTGPQFAWRLSGVVVLYFLGAVIGLKYAMVGSTVSLLWPPSGIALIALVAFGHRMAFGVLLGAFLANAWTGIPLLVALGIALGNTLEPLLGFFLLQRVAQFQPPLNRRRDVLALFVFAALLSATLGAGLGSASMALGGLIPFADLPIAALKWWLGDMMGVLVVAPPILVGMHHRWPKLAAAQIAEGLALLVSLAVTAYLVFGSPELAGHGYYPASLAVFPFVVWGALRFDHWGAVGVTLLTAILAIPGTTQGTGPFAVDSAVDSLVGWCAFVNVVAVSGLLLAASNAEQRRTRNKLRHSLEELEQRVRERTRDLARSNTNLRRQMIKRMRLEAQLIQVSEEQQKTIGRELHDGLGQHLTSVAFLGATLQQQLHKRGQAEAEAARRVVELINQAIDMTRAVARGLYPAALESGGLPTALEQLADNTDALDKVACIFNCSPGVEIHDPLVAINLYRVAQEAINNAIKHSEASHIWIELTQRSTYHRLSVSDNGVGFDPAQIEATQGLGMHSLLYRASLLRGSIAIERNGLGGTTIAVMYPAVKGELRVSRPA